MKIEIAEPGRMTQSGSSLLKLIQNNNMPILDLLVRDSIQNSLDAKNENDNLFDATPYSFFAIDSEIAGTSAVENAIFIASVRIVCKPSASRSASSRVFPCI